MMSDLFRLLLLIGVFVFFITILLLMKKGKLGLKYSLIWFLTGLVLLICGIFPNLIIALTHLVGIKSEVNAVFFIGVCFLLIIILFLTSVVSGLNDSVRGLTQSQAILEKRVRELEAMLAEEKEKSR